MANYTANGSGVPASEVPTGTIAEQIAAARDARNQRNKEEEFKRERASRTGETTYTELGIDTMTDEGKTYATLQQQAKDDPWSFYRSGFADKLAQSGSNDPTEIYRSKLQEMSTGKFGIDDPSYKFRFDQGQQALERSQASRGFLGSGNAAIELQQYGQESASQEYGAQFQRLMQAMGAVESQYNSSQNRLMQLAGIQTPGVQAGINAGITQSQISAAASMSNNAANVSENARQFNVEDMRAQQRDAGIGVGLGVGGNSWQDQVSRQMEAGNSSIRAGNNI